MTVLCPWDRCESLGAREWIMVGRIKAQQRYPPSNLWNLRICYLLWHRDFEDVIKLKLFPSWGGKLILDYLGGSSVTTRVLRGKPECESQRRRRDSGHRA